MSESVTRPARGPLGYHHAEQMKVDRAQKPWQLLMPRVFCLYGNDKYVRLGTGVDLIVPTPKNLPFDIGIGYAIMPIKQLGLAGHRFHVFFDSAKLVSFGHFQAGLYGELGDLSSTKTIRERYSFGIEVAANVSLAPTRLRKKFDLTLDAIAAFDLPGLMGFRGEFGLRTMIGGGFTIWGIF
ncbi:MAG TPA: hypothetical protein PLI17_02780 [Denitromonas sp.]|nr:hypothetical protein [Denitromonas sp.]